MHAEGDVEADIPGLRAPPVQSPIDPVAAPADPAAAQQPPPEPELIEPESPLDFNDGEYIDDRLRVIPSPNNILEPRLFKITNDGQGFEFLNEDQLKHFFKIKLKDN